MHQSKFLIIPHGSAGIAVEVAAGHKQKLQPVVLLQFGLDKRQKDFVIVLCGDQTTRIDAHDIARQPVDRNEFPGVIVRHLRPIDRVVKRALRKAAQLSARDLVSDQSQQPDQFAVADHGDFLDQLVMVANKF